MDEINNIKKIREIYDITQEEVAKAINVNRVTVANWETGTSKATPTNLEKLSLFFGIAPEYFYSKDIDENIKQMIFNTAKEARDIELKAEGKKSKVDDFSEMLSQINFDKVMRHYMISMKLLLATADSGELDKLKTASLINKKMGERLDAIISLRELEIKSDEPTLFELLDEVENNK